MPANRIKRNGAKLGKPLHGSTAGSSPLHSPPMRRAGASKNQRSDLGSKTGSREPIDRSTTNRGRWNPSWFPFGLYHSGPSSGVVSRRLDEQPKDSGTSSGTSMRAIQSHSLLHQWQRERDRSVCRAIAAKRVFGSTQQQRLGYRKADRISSTTSGATLVAIAGSLLRKQQRI